MEELSIKVNDKIDVKIEDLNSEGYGVAKINGYTLFVNNAMPGERCYVEIIELGKNFGFAKCLNVRFYLLLLCEVFFCMFGLLKF